MTKQSSIMFKKRTVQRRILHLAGSLFIGYYFIPDQIIYNINKQWILFAIGFLILIIEIHRQHTKKAHALDPLLRDYENNRPASFSYFAIGSIILLSFFPQYITIPCILSTAICDPIIGILKQSNKKFIGYVIGFSISFIIFISSWFSTNIEIWILASFLAAGTLIFAEYSSNSLIDDDFLMQILPAIILFLFSYLLSNIGLSLPNQLIYALW